jgi:hypothetical protein
MMRMREKSQIYLTTEDTERKIFRLAARYRPNENPLIPQGGIMKS